MKDYQLTKVGLPKFFEAIESELDADKSLIINSQAANIGKWGLAKLWRMWMTPTAKFMRSQGVTMPLYFKANGDPVGKREFNDNDCHELFTYNWLGVDRDGNRLSWSRSGRDGMRAATKGERFIALQKHDNWAVEKGITLFKPRDSDYKKLEDEQNY